MKTDVWDMYMKRGNPTQSVELNELVKKLKKLEKLEIHSVGISSKVVRQLGKLEREQIFTIFLNSSSDEVKYAFLLFIKTQFCMNIWLDDTVHIFLKS